LAQSSWLLTTTTVITYQRRYPLFIPQPSNYYVSRKAAKSSATVCGSSVCSPLVLHYCPLISVSCRIAPVDWRWQNNFTIIYCSVLALSLAISLPRLVRAIKQGRAFKGLFGVSEIWDGNNVVSSGDSKRRGLPSAKNRRVEAILNKTVSVLWWSLPGLELNLGQSQFSIPIPHFCVLT
jgi:hypothetical protein